VASGTGAEAPAATGCVGMVTKAATGSCSGTGGRRDGRSPGAGCAWAAAEEPCGGSGYTAAAAAALHSALCSAAAGETE
jgi:hypothetical protein